MERGAFRLPDNRLPGGVIGRIGRTPLLRDIIMRGANAFGGFLDRLVHARRLAVIHRDSPLPRFAAVDARLCRGGQPSAEGFRLLREERAIELVVNLRYEDRGEGGLVRSLGMDYREIAIPDTDIPTPRELLAFLRLFEDYPARRVFVHCASGQMRTSLMAGLYRLSRGAGLGEVLREAEGFGFDPEWMLGYRELALLKNFAADPAGWLARARALPPEQQDDREASLRIRMEVP